MRKYTQVWKVLAGTILGLLFSFGGAYFQRAPWITPMSFVGGFVIAMILYAIIGYRRFEIEASGRVALPRLEGSAGQQVATAITVAAAAILVSARVLAPMTRESAFYSWMVLIFSGAIAAACGFWLFHSILIFLHILSTKRRAKSGL